MTTRTPKTQSDRLEEFGLVSLSEFLDDRLIYRDLQPVDRSYQGYVQCARHFGLDPADIPRKTDPEYSKVAVWIVDHMQEHRTDAEIEELLFIGDTYGTDGVAYSKMISFTQWQGSCFICSEDTSVPAQLQWGEQNQIVEANRWSHLVDWMHGLRQSGMALDTRTAVVVDIDKTVLGARGRNDTVIDEARLASLHQALKNQLTPDFDFTNFRIVYDAISQPEYIALTGDNQDYIIYICLMVLSGVINIREVGNLIQQNMQFDHLVRWISTQVENLSMQMRQLHDQYQMCSRNGDRTPFKQFRRQEFLDTAQRMGQLPAGISLAKRLQTEICITQEIRELCLWLQEREVLLLSLSDKPREATMPHKRWHKGLLPLHHIPTHAIGCSIRQALDDID